MEEENKQLPEKEEEPKSPWQAKKESWYDKIPLSVKQLDIIIYICWALLALFVIGVLLDATGIYDVF